jgi:transglutaminase superfamily protein
MAGLLVLVVSLALLASQAEIVVVTSEENGEIPVASYALREDDFHHPRLQLLRSRERLDEVVSGAPTQFNAILRLLHWTRRQWQPGGTFRYPPWDAVEIIDLARQHGNRGFCAQYAIVLLQACQSMGIHARYIDLPGHFVIAAWSDDFDRWVTLDPLNDAWYEKDGQPMRGRELYRAYWSGDRDGVFRVDAAGNRTPVPPEDLGYYRLYSISMAANQLSSPVEVRINGAWRTLTHAADWRTYPLVGRDVVEVASEFLAWRTSDASESFPARPETGDEDEFRYAQNQTILVMANERVSNRILKLALLSGNSPASSRFLIRSDEKGEWVPAPAPTVKWLLSPGSNVIYARLETEFGWRGPTSHLQVFYKPALLPLLPALRGGIFRLSWHQAAPPV